jgi:DNA-binding MarR family transcriptional regulator
MPEMAQTTPASERYFQGIAEAHYVIRKAFRIVDDLAKQAGLDPLEHKVLIQAFGARGGPLRVNEVAARLDVAPAFASRLIKTLEERQLLEWVPSDEDRRATNVKATDAARDLLAEIDRRVRVEVEYFQHQLSDEERADALRIFGFYVGADI